jgi:hypothetical protein
VPILTRFLKMGCLYSIEIKDEKTIDSSYHEYNHALVNDKKQIMEILLKLNKHMINCHKAKCQHCEHILACLAPYGNLIQKLEPFVPIETIHSNPVLKTHQLTQIIPSHMQPIKTNIKDSKILDSQQQTIWHISPRNSPKIHSPIIPDHPQTIISILTKQNSMQK